MSITSDALRRLVAQIGDGKDVVIGGTPVQARQILAEAAVVLAERATVVSIASPTAELGLSAVIAQLSGRPDFDDQDDAVLQAGLKRLTGEGQTVLTVLAPAGISRSALRYIQHVLGYAPRLTIAMYDAPSLASTMLDDAGLATIRTRLHAAPKIDVEAPAEPAAPRPATVAAPLFAVAPEIGSGLAPDLEEEWRYETRPRRRMLWVASALSAAMILGFIWLAQSAPGTAVAGGRVAGSDTALAPAVVPPPAIAGLPNSAQVKASPAAPVIAAAPQVAPVSPSAVTRSTPATAENLPVQTPPPAPSHPETVIARQQPKIDRPARRAERNETLRNARARPSWPPPRDQEPTVYARSPAWDGVSPLWTRRDVRRETPYLGTYGANANGVRVFEYDN